MPLVTRASAADLTRSSVTLQAKRFQLFQPMGGVRAKPFSRARAGGTQKRIPKRDSARQRVFFLNVFMKTLRLILVSFLSRLKDKTPTRAVSEHSAPDKRKNHGRREMLLRSGGCNFCGGVRSVDNDGLFTAFGGGGVDGVQVDAFGREFVQTLRQRARLIGQIVGFRGSFLV